VSEGHPCASPNDASTHTKIIIKKKITTHVHSGA